MVRWPSAAERLTKAMAAPHNRSPRRPCPRLQPGGFQYVLRYSCHSADISALALATKLKLAAVADDSGTLSLLDLLQV